MTKPNAAVAKPGPDGDRRQVKPFAIVLAEVFRDVFGVIRPRNLIRQKQEERDD
jgi:hypothetical protein